MLLTLSLLGVLVADSLPAPSRAPLAVESDVPAATLVVHSQPSLPLVALRLSLLANDPPGYAGAGHLMQHLLLPELQRQAARVGATVQMERSSDAVAYTITGPAAEMDHLAAILRGALRAPRATEVALLAASRALAEERLAEWETARQHIRAALRTRLFPGDISAAGTESGAQRLTLDALPRVWAWMYQPTRVAVVAVGDVEMRQVQAAFAELPDAPVAPAAVEERSDTVSLLALAPAEATRGWLSAGYLAGDLNAAVVSVVAHLIAEDLRTRLPGVEVEAEHWWTHHGHALVLVVGAPERDLAAARRALNTAVSSLGREVSERRVRDATRTIRRDMLFYARTPARMAEVLGRFVDRQGDPDAAQRFYAALEEVEADDVEEALRYLLEHTPVRAEVAPQQLKTRP